MAMLLVFRIDQLASQDGVRLLFTYDAFKNEGRSDLLLGARSSCEFHI